MEFLKVTVTLDKEIMNVNDAYLLTQSYLINAHQIIKANPSGENRYILVVTSECRATFPKVVNEIVYTKSPESIVLL